MEKMPTIADQSQQERRSRIITIKKIIEKVGLINRRELIGRIMRSTGLAYRAIAECIAALIATGEIKETEKGSLRMLEIASEEDLKKKQEINKEFEEILNSSSVNQQQLQQQKTDQSKSTEK